MTDVIFRAYQSADHQSCIDIFDANSPDFFARNERQDYVSFLEKVSVGYEVCEADGRVVGAFGMFGDGKGEQRLNWILLDPKTQGVGIGKKIMGRVIGLGYRASARQVNIAASQKSAPFFARFGATPSTTIIEGWGPGLDRVDMVLLL